jgi:hypothetical protein
MASAGGPLVSELERLAAVHRQGDLTAEEFSAAKLETQGQSHT